jgi:modulator of FtsH protease
MDSTAIDAWETFYSAQLSAAVTLAGLIFVGLSINLSKIIASPEVANRALLSIFVLLGVVLIASYMLMPHLSVLTVGWLVVVTGVLFALYATVVEIRTLRRHMVRDTSMFAMNMVLLECAIIPCVIGGLLLVAGSGSGFYWIAAGVILAFVKAIADAWVLLVEINR